MLNESSSGEPHHGQRAGSLQKEVKVVRLMWNMS